MPAVSVITPIYNVEKFLPRCLDSLLAQTLSDVEFICIDDGSADASVRILRDYERRDSRVVAIYKENSGYGSTMNLGLDRATGDYIAIVESDDFIAPDALERLYALAETNGQPDIVKANFYRFSEEGGEVFVENFGEDCCGRVLDPSGNQAKSIIEAIPSIWAAIYRRSFLEENNIRFLETPGASFQDTGFVFKSLVVANSMYITHDAFLRYRIDNQASSVKSADKVFCICDEFASIERFLGSYPERRERLSALLVKRKFSAYRWNYRRLSGEPSREFLLRFSDEMRLAQRRGLLKEGMFSKGQWCDVNCIIDSPISYENRERAKGEAPERPKVSVVITSYNSSNHISETLRCVAEQTLFDIEVICVDDGSTDRTPDILRKFASKDRRFKVIRQKNAGAAMARNRGIEMARGDYLSILDADDLFERTMLEQAYGRALEADADIVVFRSDQFNSKSGKRKGLAHTMRTHLMPKVEPFAGADLERDAFNVFMGWAWDKLFRRGFIMREGLSFQDLRSTNDMLFVFSAIVRARRIATLSDTLAHYRRGEGGISETREREWDCFYRALVALREQLREWRIYERFERDFVNYCVQLATWHVKTVSEPTRSLMVERLRCEWFENLGVTGRKRDYFYDEKMYRSYLAIMEERVGDMRGPGTDCSAIKESARKRGVFRKAAAAYGKGGAGAKDVAKAVKKRFAKRL